MDEWQAKALKAFPELHSQITRSQGGLHGLWADFFSAMVAAYRATPPNEDSSGESMSTQHGAFDNLN